MLSEEEKEINKKNLERFLNEELDNMNIITLYELSLPLYLITDDDTIMGYDFYYDHITNFTYKPNRNLDSLKKHVRNTLKSECFDIYNIAYMHFTLNIKYYFIVKDINQICLKLFPNSIKCNLELSKITINNFENLKNIVKEDFEWLNIEIEKITNTKMIVFHKEQQSNYYIYLHTLLNNIKNKEIIYLDLYNIYNNFYNNKYNRLLQEIINMSKSNIMILSEYMVLIQYNQYNEDNYKILKSSLVNLIKKYNFVVDIIEKYINTKNKYDEFIYILKELINF